MKTKLIVIRQKVDQIQRRMGQLQDDPACQQREDTGKLSSPRSSPIERFEESNETILRVPARRDG